MTGVGVACGFCRMREGALPGGGCSHPPRVTSAMQDMRMPQFTFIPRLVSRSRNDPDLYTARRASREQALAGCIASKTHRKLLPVVAVKTIHRQTGDDRP